MKAWEMEATLRDLQDAIYSQIKQEHPILVGDINFVSFHKLVNETL